MRLIADGTTTASQLVLVNELESDDGYAFELDSPLFLAVGDQVSFEGSDLVVARASGERLRAAYPGPRAAGSAVTAPPPPLDLDGSTTA